MITVKVSNEFLDWPLIRQTPGSSGIWGNCRFAVNEPVAQCDFWVVYDGLPKAETTKCPPGNTIFITGEPPQLKAYNPAFLNQFGTVITCHNDIEHPGVIRTQQSLPWHIGRKARGDVSISFSRNYDELKGIGSFDKTKLISAISSNKTISDGHIKRVEFVRRLKQRLGSEIEIFGRGIRDIEDKWDAIHDFKYHIVLENCSCKDYWTEKLADAFLAGAYPFYYGCPNIFDYFPAGSLTVIDIDDFDRSLAVIKEALESDLYSQSVAGMKQARDLVLDKYNLFSFLSSFCLGRNESKASADVTLIPEAGFRKQPRNLRTIINWILNKNG